MKKLYLIFSLLTICANTSLASFPITDNIKIKQDNSLQAKEINQYHLNLIKMGIDLNNCKCNSCRSDIPIPLEIRKKSTKLPIEYPHKNIFKIFLVTAIIGLIMMLYGIKNGTEIGDGILGGYILIASMLALLINFLIFLINMTPKRQGKG